MALLPFSKLSPTSECCYLPVFENYCYLITTIASVLPVIPDASGYHMMLVFIKPEFAMAHTIAIWMGKNLAWGPDFH